MTHLLSWEMLNDLVDGVLPQAASAEAEQHARECTECGTALAELRATIVAASALPSSVAPPDDLWGDVRATIEAGKVAHLPSGTQAARPRGWWVTPQRLAAAAVVLIAATASLTGIVMRSQTGAFTVAGVAISIGAAVHLWESDTWTRLQTLVSDGTIYSMAFSTDRRYVVAGTGNGRGVVAGVGEGVPGERARAARTTRDAPRPPEAGDHRHR